MRTLDLGLLSWAVKAENSFVLKVEELEKTATFQKLDFYVKKQSFLKRTQPLQTSKVTIYNATTYIKSYLK